MTLKQIWNYLKEKRCPLCLKAEWKRVGTMTDAQMLMDLEKVLKQKEQILRQKFEYVTERDTFLDKKEKLLDKEKEALLGPDGSTIRRGILLPPLKRKWLAEKNKIDADRIIILKTTPRVSESIDAIKAEAELALKNVKNKPSTQSNRDLRTRYEATLDAINDMISIIDRNKEELDEMAEINI